MRRLAVAGARRISTPTSASSSPSLPCVGFIGLGNMGMSMAENLAKSRLAGETIYVFDVNKDAAQELSRKFPGVVIASPDVPSLARSCRIIVTMVPATAHVESLVYGHTAPPAPAATTTAAAAATGGSGIFANALPGALLIDCSTIDPLTSKRLASEAAALPARLTFIDAPVSGGVTGAAAATLTFMLGADSPEAVERASAVLQRMGKKIVLCGPPGSGGITKLCNNLSLAVSMVGVAEAMNLGVALGMDPAKLSAVMNASTARCWASDSYNPVPGVMEGVPASRNYAGGFGAALMRKDLGLAIDAAAAAGALPPAAAAAACAPAAASDGGAVAPDGQRRAALPLGRRALEIYSGLVSQGHGGRDFGVVYEALRAGRVEE